MDYKVGLIVPALNEVGTIYHVFYRAPKSFRIYGNIYHVEPILVDGGSTDGTVEKGKQGGAKHVLYDKPINGQKGKGVAVKQGWDFAKDELGCEYIVMADGDDTHPTSEMHRLIKALEDNPKAGMAVGNCVDSIEGMIWKKLRRKPLDSDEPDVPFSTLVGHRITHYLTQLQFILIGGWDPGKDVLNGYRAWHSDLEFDVYPGFCLETGMQVSLHEQNIPIVIVPYTYNPRSGKSKYLFNFKAHRKNMKLVSSSRFNK